MKKTLLTLSLVALFSAAASAQDNAQPIKKQHPKKGAPVKDDGTSATPANTTNMQTDEKKSDGPVKKGGTRMAINEKGTSGKTKTAPKHEEKKSEVQPAAGTGTKAE